MKIKKFHISLIAIIWAAFLVSLGTACVEGKLSTVYLIGMGIPWSFAFGTVYENMPDIGFIRTILILGILAFLNCLYLTELLLKKGRIE